MAQGAAGIGGRAEVEVVDPHVGCELEAALGRQALVMPAKDKVAQASASWPCWRPPLAPDRVGAPGCPEPRPASAKFGRWVRAGVGAREGWRRVLWPSPVCDQARCVSGSSMSGSSFLTEGHSTALPLTAGTVRLRSVKRVPPPASGVDRYMKKV